MKKRLCLVLACLMLLTLGLTACNEDGVPDGYKLASDPQKDGFSLYIPEAWNYNTTGGVLSAYPSSISTANVTVTYLTSPQPTLSDYWVEQEAILKGDFSDFALVNDQQPGGKEINGYYAYIYEYTLSYIAVQYRVRQYIIPVEETAENGLKMYVLTYTASNEKSDYTGSVDFESSLAQLEELVGYFKIDGVPGIGGADLSVKDDENAPEGMKRANQFAYLGMNVYVPNTWYVYLSDGFIAATTADGKGEVNISNIDLTGSAAGSNNLAGRFEHYGIELMNPQGTTLIDYWNLLKAEYNDYFDNFTVLSEPVWEEDLEAGVEKTPPTVAGESSYYVFTFAGEKYGTTYVVTQYFFRETSSRTGLFRNLTYTTVGAENHIHGEEIAKVLAEVKY